MCCSNGIFRSSIMELDCKQYTFNDSRCPILPPDSQQCPQRGEDFRKVFTDVDEARDAYKIGMKMTGTKHRKYLKGARYRNVLFDKAIVLDVRDYGGLLNLNVRVDDHTISTFKVRDLNHEIEALDFIKKFSETSNKDSEARSSAGDFGSMFAFGKHNRVNGDYISMKDTSMDIRNYCLVSRKLLDKYFREDVRKIIDADRKQGITASKSMGGNDGISAYCLISRDLINAAHYDLDTTVSITIFHEKIDGIAKDWFFVLPNTVVNGKNSNKAVVIKLFDGCTLCWDGRKIYHCTGTRDIGEGNHLYGNFWGGKTYR